MTQRLIPAGSAPFQWRMHRWLLPATLIVFVATSCARRETVTVEQKTTYQESARSRLEAIRAEIDSLNAKAAVAGESLKVDLTHQIENLSAQRDSAEAAIARLQDATSEAWEDTKAGTDRMLEGLEHGIAEARAKLQSRADTTGT